MSLNQSIFLSLSAVLACACSGNPASPPSVPTTPSSSASPIVSVTISGLPTSPGVGLTTQLSAQIVRQDGTSADGTSQATWQSTNSSIAAVSATGILTIAGPGEADINATVQSIRGTAHLVVPTPAAHPTLYDLEGFVHQGAPTPDVAVADATVGIHFVGCPACPHDNETTTTDQTGRFSLKGIETAGFALVVSKPGYETTTYSIAQLPRDQRPDITIVPDATPVTTRFSADLCADAAYWFPGNPNVTTPQCRARQTPVVVVRHHTFPVHRAGVVEINMAWVYQEDYSSEYMGLDVHCGAVAATQAYRVNDYLLTYFPGPAPATRVTNFFANVVEPGPLRVSVPSASVCDISPNRYWSFKGSSLTTYYIDIAHPR